MIFLTADMVISSLLRDLSSVTLQIGSSLNPTHSLVLLAALSSDLLMADAVSDDTFSFGLLLENTLRKIYETTAVHEYLYLSPAILLGAIFEDLVNFPSCSYFILHTGSDGKLISPSFHCLNNLNMDSTNFRTQDERLSFIAC